MAPSISSHVIDIHTHIYPPSYLNLLSSRTTPPQLLQPGGSSPDNPPPPPRLIILPSDAPSANPDIPPSKLGRPIGPEYSSPSSILSFMSTHKISISILSLANPWLDFLPSSSAAEWASSINDELNAISAESRGRIYAFGCLPLSAPIPAITAEIARIASPTTCPYIRGIILGTSGLGAGLDDPAMDPIWATLQDRNLLAFIHPHYGLPSEVLGARAQKDSGHVLPLSLGFPLETTIAFTRMYLAGVFDRFPSLSVLLAHAGGAVPALAGRVQSCVEHERGYYDHDGDREEEEGRKRVRGPKRTLAEVLGQNVYLDAVSYGTTGLRAAVDVVGNDRVMFGTDHPFFPPLGEERGEWTSVVTNMEAARGVFGEDGEGMEGVLGGNAIRVFGLDVEALKD
ncbi:MAG: hypothetical protein LQ338_001492 [Usnochroma carphineum]|nr:MAG: hypothetical protein LQ338_001492 [Usnochroma carphineum]